MTTLVLVEVAVLAAKKQTLIKMLASGFVDTRAFDGCINIQAYFNEDEQTFVMVEHWQSKAHYLKYYQWRERTGALDELQSCFDGDARIRFFEPIEI